MSWQFDGIKYENLKCQCYMHTHCVSNRNNFIVYSFSVAVADEKPVFFAVVKRFEHIENFAQNR